MSAVWPAAAAMAALSAYLFLLFYGWFHWLARQLRRAAPERFRRSYVERWFLFIALSVLPVTPLGVWLRHFYGDHDFLLRSVPVIAISFIPALTWWSRKRPQLQALLDKSRAG